LFIFDARQIQVRKRFFLKKEAKTLALWRVAASPLTPSKAKVFWFFFAKKNASLTAPPPPP
jgi:hypothetical protein